MADGDEYRWDGTRVLSRADADPVAPGETFVPTVDEFDAFGDLMAEVVDESEPEPEPEPEPTDESPVAPFDPRDHSVASLRGELGDGEFTAAELDAIRKLEHADGGARATALDALDRAEPSDESED